MSALDELMTSISATSSSTEEVSQQIAANKQQCDEILAQLQAVGADAAAGVLSSAKDQLEECDALAASLKAKLDESMSTVEAVKHT